MKQDETCPRINPEMLKFSLPLVVPMFDNVQGDRSMRNAAFSAHFLKNFRVIQKHQKDYTPSLFSDTDHPSGQPGSSFKNQD